MTARGRDQFRLCTYVGTLKHLLLKPVVRVEDNLAEMIIAFEWRFAGGPILARFYMLTGRLIYELCHAKVQIRLFFSMRKYR